MTQFVTLTIGPVFGVESYFPFSDLTFGLEQKEGLLLRASLTAQLVKGFAWVLPLLLPSTGVLALVWLGLGILNSNPPLRP